MIINNFVRVIDSVTILEIASLTNSKIIDKLVDDKLITGVSSLKLSKIGDISFCNNLGYVDDLKSTKATACFITEKYQHHVPQGVIALVCKDPYTAFAMVLNKFYQSPKVIGKISENAEVDTTAVIGKNVHIGAFSVIGKNVHIGDNTYIGTNVVISDNVKIGSDCYIYGSSSIKYASIGNDCIIHEGVRIGQDGFGFVPNMLGHIKIPQIAQVQIGSHVEIGANSCIDRGAVNDTIIGDGTKIDNLVQVAHGVIIGSGCFLASGVGIAGSVVVGDFVSIGGGSGIAPHLNIGSGAQIAPMSGVSNNIDAGAVVIGIPAINFRSFWKIQALLKKMLNKKV